MFEIYITPPCAITRILTVGNVKLYALRVALCVLPALAVEGARNVVSFGYEILLRNTCRNVVMSSIRNIVGNVLSLISYIYVPGCACCGVFICAALSVDGAGSACK